MKEIIKFLLVLLAVFCFVLACEQKEPTRADLTSYDEIFGDQDTMYSGDLRPAALRIIFGEKRFWRLSDSTFALMSQDTSNMQETVVREDSIFAWFMSKLPDSLNLAAYSDTLRVSNDTLYISGQETGFFIGGGSNLLAVSDIGDSISIQSVNSVALPYRVFGVDASADISGNVFPEGSRIVNRITGAQYLVQEDSVDGYETDGIAVITTGDNYAVLNSPNGSYPVTWFGAVADSMTNAISATNKAILYADHEVYFPPGNYWMNGTITTKNNLTLRGAKGTVFYKDQDAGSSIWINANEDQRVLIENIRFVNHSTSNFQQFVAMDDSRHCEIRNCWFELTVDPPYGYTQQAILGRGAYNLKVKDNHFIGVQVKIAGASRGAQNIWILNNYFHSPHNLAISSVVNGSSNDTIRNHYIIGNVIEHPASQGGIFIGGDGENADPPHIFENIYVKDNIIRGTGPHADSITTTTYIDVKMGIHNRNIDISGNILVNEIVGATGNTVGIDVKGSDSLQYIYENIRIDNNVIGRMSKWGIRFACADSITKAVSISGNRMKRNRGIEFIGYSGSVEGVSITDNYFDSIGIDPLLIGLGGRVTGFWIHGNVMINPTAAGQDAIDITMSSATNMYGINVTENTIGSGWGTGVKLTNSGGATHDMFVFGNTNLATTPLSGVSAATLDNIYTANGTLSANRSIDLDGKSFTFYDNTFGSLPAVSLHSDRNGSGATPRLNLLNNDVAYFMQLNGLTGQLEIGSGSNEIIRIAAGAVDNTFVIPATGGFSSGIATATERYQFRHTGNFNFFIESTSTSGIPSLNIVNGDQNWALQNEGNNNDQFSIRDLTGVTKPFIIQKGTSSNNALVINTGGETQFGFSTAQDQGAFKTQVNGNSYVSGEMNIGSTTDAGAFALQVTGTARINQVMLLVPGTEPGSPAKGMLYVNDSDSHIYFYNGTTWVQLDN